MFHETYFPIVELGYTICYEHSTIGLKTMKCSCCCSVRDYSVGGVWISKKMHFKNSPSIPTTLIQPLFSFLATCAELPICVSVLCLKKLFFYFSKINSSTFFALNGLASASFIYKICKRTKSLFFPISAPTPPNATFNKFVNEVQAMTPPCERQLQVL